MLPAIPATVVTVPEPWVALDSLSVFATSTKTENVRRTIC